MNHSQWIYRLYGDETTFLRQKGDDVEIVYAERYYDFHRLMRYDDIARYLAAHEVFFQAPEIMLIMVGLKND